MPCRRGSAQPCSPDHALPLQPMTDTTPLTSGRTSRLTGYLLALAAGATWGTTGPLSTGLYGLMPATSIGFWRVLLGTVCLALWGLAFRRKLFRVDRAGWLLVGLGGGFLVALFEVAYQYAIAGAGVAGAAAMLYTAPVIVAVLARLILKEALTPIRLLLALIVMVGVALTVTGGSNSGAEAARLGIGAGVAGGLLSAVSYALTTLMARFAVPRYGAVQVLFLEAVGGVVILGIVLTLAGRMPTPPPSLAAWRGLAALTAGSVLAANLFFFAAVKRIEAAPAAVAATIEPVVGTALALLLFHQQLSPLGWVGLTMVVAGAETIRYANNSPDTLRYVWLQLDQNIYKANSRGAALNPTDARFAGRGFEGGYRIEYIRAVRRIGQAAGRIPLASAENGTMLRVDLDRPLAPGGRT